MVMRFKIRQQSLKFKIIIGYIFIFSLIGCILYTWHNEKQELISFEMVNKEIDDARKQVYDIYEQITELSLLGENILEWDNMDAELYSSCRMVIDSMLCCFKKVYPTGRIDSVRHLLEAKEKHMLTIMQVLDKQDSLNEKIARQMPTIIKKSTQEEQGKTKRKFLGRFFGKKEKANQTTTMMLYTLNRDVISQQQIQGRKLSEFADSLAARNSELNYQLRMLIRQMNEKVRNELQRRETEITTMREKSFLQISTLTGFLFVLLVVSFIVIIRNIKRIKCYKLKTIGLIKKLHESDLQNKELFASRKRTLQTITHELRTPLTTIYGYAELIPNEKCTSKIEHYSDNIRIASQRMITMLNSLLSFFRLDSGKEQLNMIPFRLQDVATSLKAEFMPQADAKDLQLIVVCDTDVILKGDRECIMQVCDNLLTNAIKFTQAGHVSLHMVYSSGMLNIIVEDTGSGMGKDEQRRIFNAFERLSNSVTQDGFGLGLSIVRRIVDMLGGIIHLESEKGKGSRFCVEIPMQTADILLEEKVENHNVSFRKSYSVIVLDDNEIILSMMKDMYASVGVHCDMFSNVGDMVEALRIHSYDFLITDLKMPEINGFEVLELLRSSHIGNSQKIPVVVATASGSSTEEELETQGFTACLFKPFSISELLAVSEKCLPTGTEKEERPDLTALLAYGDKAIMLDRLITETEKDMQTICNARERCDRKILDEWVHHLRSSWAVIRADKPLWVLHGLLHREMECSNTELENAINAVLRMGAIIIELAKEKRRQIE